MANNKEYQDIALRNKMSNDVPSNVPHTLLATLSATVTATAALVSIHHYFRKKQQPKARLQDYIVGINAQLHSLPSAPLPRLRYAYQQAKLAYQNYPESSIHEDSFHAAVNQGEASAITDFHTTTILPRPVCWVSGVAAKNRYPE